MLNRLGLVIHWLGFIGSVGFTGLYFFAPKHGFIIFEYEYWIQLVAAAFVPLEIARAIRFILTSYKGLMPWSKAEQPASPENYALSGYSWEDII